MKTYQPTFRAAFWISADAQAEVLLTGPEHADLPDDELLAVAREVARDTGLEVGDGAIRIGAWTPGPIAYDDPEETT